ncbi:potassium transporter Kup [Dokdonella soli]|uniref:Probable potassium transport system protein Kup n=1 Tax=Dokdonella soli TaxID=529810 RepID=A0ABN1IHQ8_9GAMM
MNDDTQQHVTSTRLSALALGAIGVVFGDIGTSPLYTVKEVFNTPGVELSPQTIFGMLSLIFWALVLTVSLKYVVFIMRADNKGEGGMMALMALAQRSARTSPRARWWIVMFGLFGASLFYGDGVITPAISVLSAMEGIEVAAPALQPYIVPVTVLIIIALFALQRYGTARVGAMFGPVMVIWFICIALLGVRMIVQQPQVLLALNPWYGFEFFAQHRIHAFLALGGVVLALTGAEALYADMGHFGKQPIRLAWFGFVSPALVLNYFGQGALLLTNPKAIENPFYLLVPPMLLYPAIVLAAVATVIASQAVISGAFSMTREAIQLGYAPRMKIVHTSREVSGQIFLPWINRLLLVLVIAAVIGFRSSDNLGAAYGIAVTGTMVITTALALIVARRIWGWSRLAVALTGAVFLTIDASFFAANAVKIEHGGWFPLVLGVVVFTILATWRRGRELVIREVKQGGLALEPFIASIAAHPPLRVPGSAVFLTANQAGVPHALLHNLKHNKVLHERNVILTVETVETPMAEAAERFSVESLGGSFYKLILRFGFAEDPDVPDTLAMIKQCGLPFDLMDTTFFLSRESIVATDRPGMALWRDKLFAFLQRNAIPATAFFRIPGNRLVELGTQVEI